MVDIIVIGCGPAGMTAALYALRNGKSVLVLEKNGIGGQITYSPKVENYPGTASMSGNEFADRLFEQITALGAEIELEKAVSVEQNGREFAVSTEEGSRYACRSVVIAVGVKHRMLGLPGEGELVGNGVSFCAVCDADFYSGKTVCVAGGGNSALQEAILLAGKCREVCLVHYKPTMSGETKLQELLSARSNVKLVLNTKITGLDCSDGILSAVIGTEQSTGAEVRIPCDGLFEAVGLIPENDAFSALAELNERGYFTAGESCAAGTPGVFVAGDCREKTVRQLTTAVGDGAVAGLAACSYIDREF